MMTEQQREERQEMVAEYRSSGESAGSFCKRHGLRTSTLYYWLSKDKKPATTVKMLPVISSESKIRVDAVELLMPKGALLRFSPGTSAHYVADIVRALA